MWLCFLPFVIIIIFTEYDTELLKGDLDKRPASLSTATRYFDCNAIGSQL